MSKCSAPCTGINAPGRLGPALDDDVFCCVIAQSERDDFVQQLWITQAAMRGGISKILVLRDLRIGIRFEQVALSLTRHPVIEAGIAARSEERSVGKGWRERA